MIDEIVDYVKFLRLQVKVHNQSKDVSSTSLITNYPVFFFVHRIRDLKKILSFKLLSNILKSPNRFLVLVLVPPLSTYQQNFNLIRSIFKMW